MPILSFLATSSRTHAVKRLLAFDGQPLTVPTVPNAPRRSSARRPDLSAELSRYAVLLELAGSTTDWLVDISEVDAGAASFITAQRALVDEHDPERCHITNRRVMCQAVAKSVTAQVRDAQAREEFALSELTGVKTPLRTDAQLLRALRHAGVEVSDLSPESLRPFSRRLVVRQVERVRRLAQLGRYASADFALELGVAYDSAPTTDRVTACSAIATLGGDPQSVLDSLIRFEAGRHLNLVRHQANRLVRSYGGYSADDFIGWGWKGLCSALGAYDPSTYAFSTYACTRITGAIQDGVRAESFLPKRLATYARHVRATQATLSQSLGRDPSRDELVRAVALDRLLRELGRQPSEQEIAQRVVVEDKALGVMPRLSMPASFSESTTDLVDQVDPESDAMRAITQRAVHTAIESLPDDEAEAVWLLDIEGLTLEQARERTGATTRQLRSRRARARALLSQSLADWA